MVVWTGQTKEASCGRRHGIGLLEEMPDAAAHSPAALVRFTRKRSRRL